MITRLSVAYGCLWLVYTVSRALETRWEPHVFYCPFRVYLETPCAWMDSHGAVNAFPRFLVPLACQCGCLCYNLTLMLSRSECSLGGCRPFRNAITGTRRPILFCGISRSNNHRVYSEYSQRRKLWADIWTLHNTLSLSSSFFILCSSRCGIASSSARGPHGNDKLLRATESMLRTDSRRVIAR